MGKILSLTGRIQEISKGFKDKPPWFAEYWKKPVVYHRDCLIHFKLVKDADRFSTGYAWFCRDCNKPVFCYEHFFEEFDYFAVVKLICHLGCQAAWRMQEIDPLIATFAESIDFSAFEETDGGLVLKSGILLKRIYSFQNDEQQEPDVTEVYS